MNTERDNEMGKLIKWGTIVVAILGLFLLTQTLNAFKEWRYPGPNLRTISVVGEGEVFAVSDIATFTFAVSADSASVTDAQEKVTEKMDAVLDAIKSLGVEERDIRTSNYYVSPKYTNETVVCSPGYCPPSKQIPDGYTVSHDVTIKVRKVDEAGKIIGIVGEKGATNISGISFTTDDPSTLQDEARGKAIENAKEKADTLASSLGVKLVRVVGFYDNGGNYPMPYYREGMSSNMDQAVKSSAPNLPVGENQIVSNITVEYEIR